MPCSTSSRREGPLIKEIVARDIVRTFNSRFTLRCSIELESGQTHALLGPNGSGKSTLLRILSLLERPQQGEVVYRDENEDHINPFSDLALRRRVTLVNTRPVVFRESVLKNVTYGLRIRGIGRGKSMERAMEALRSVGLEHLKNQPAPLLSSGEKQRLSLARAIAIDPDVLMLDEPTVNLDPENTGIIEQAIMALHEKGQRLILFVTHNLFQARKLADKVFFIHNGRIIEQNSRERFFSSPETELARRFLRGEIY